jgi:hypothetical protein
MRSLIIYSLKYMSFAALNATRLLEGFDTISKGLFHIDFKKWTADNAKAKRKLSCHAFIPGKDHQAGLLVDFLLYDPCWHEWFEQAGVQFGSHFPDNREALLPLYLWDDSLSSQTVIKLGLLADHDPRIEPDAESEPIIEEPRSPSPPPYDDMDVVVPEGNEVNGPGEGDEGGGDDQAAKGNSGVVAKQGGPSVSDEDEPAGDEDESILDKVKSVRVEDEDIQGEVKGVGDGVVDEEEEDTGSKDKDQVTEVKGVGDGVDDDDEEEEEEEEEDTGSKDKDQVTDKLKGKGKSDLGRKATTGKGKDADDAAYKGAGLSKRKAPAESRGKTKKSRTVLTDTDDDSTPSELVNLGNDISKARRRKYAINASAKIFSAFAMGEVEAIADGSDGITYMGSRPGPGALGSESNPIILDSAKNPIAFVGPADLFGRLVTDPAVFRSMQDPNFQDILYKAAVKLAQLNKPPPQSSKAQVIQDRWNSMRAAGALDVTTIQEFYATNADCEAVDHQIDSMDAKYKHLLVSGGTPKQVKLPAIAQPSTDHNMDPETAIESD